MLNGDAAGGFLRGAHFRSASLSRLLLVLFLAKQEKDITHLAITKNYSFWQNKGLPGHPGQALALRFAQKIRIVFYKSDIHFDKAKEIMTNVI